MPMGRSRGFSTRERVRRRVSPRALRIPRETFKAVFGTLSLAEGNTLLSTGERLSLNRGDTLSARSGETLLVMRGRVNTEVGRFDTSTQRPLVVGASLGGQIETIRSETVTALKPSVVYRFT